MDDRDRFDEFARLATEQRNPRTMDLDTLGTPRGFTVRHLREGSLPTYQLAFLMADYLIVRDGFSRVAGYFRSFERRQDRHANFRETFGQSLDQFEREVLGHLKTVVR